MNYVWKHQSVTPEIASVPAVCNRIIFINKGTKVAYINDYPMNPLESIELPGELGEQDKTNYKIAFAGGPGVALVSVWRKIYS